MTNQITGASPQQNYFGLLDQKAQERCLKEAAQKHMELFKVQLEAMRLSIGLKRPPAKERLQTYMQRSADQWEMYRANRPDLYAAQMDDFTKLEKAEHAKQAVRLLRPQFTESPQDVGPQAPQSPAPLSP